MVVMCQIVAECPIIYWDTRPRADATRDDQSWSQFPDTDRSNPGGLPAQVMGTSVSVCKEQVVWASWFLGLLGESELHDSHQAPDPSLSTVVLARTGFLWGRRDASNLLSGTPSSSMIRVRWHFSLSTPLAGNGQVSTVPSANDVNN